MKKVIIILVLILLFSVNSYSQSKVSFTLVNPRVSGTYFLFDLQATVPAGQVWKVGASNIRVNFTTTPPNCLTVKADNPALNANSNISNANGYQAMTTTSVASGAAIGLNILTFNTSGFYQFSPGQYLLGTLRWNIVSTPFTNAAMTFRVPPEQFPSVVFDSTVQLVYNTGYTVVNPVVTNITELASVPAEFRLYDNYPNPFNPSTIIKFDIPKASFTTLVIYDITGREVRTLVSENLQPGAYEITFEGSGLVSGVYFCRLKSGNYLETKKIILLK